MSGRLAVWILLPLLALIAFIAVQPNFLASLLSSESEADFSTATSECEAFVKKRFNADRVWSEGAWKKDGKTVVEVAYAASTDRVGYSLRLCVYDKDKGRLVIPSVFEQGIWQR